MILMSLRVGAKESLCNQKEECVKRGRSQWGRRQPNNYNTTSRFTTSGWRTTWGAIRAFTLAITLLLGLVT